MLVYESKSIKDDEGNFLEGLRVRDTSIKIFKSTDNKFLVITKKYFLGILIREKKVIVDDYETAERYIEDLRFEKSKRV
jgi:hypothetical protein